MQLMTYNPAPDYSLRKKYGRFRCHIAQQAAMKGEKDF
jgi:hypothetical protein